MIKKFKTSLLYLLKLIFERRALEFYEQILNERCLYFEKKVSSDLNKNFEIDPKIFKKKIIYDLSIVIPSYCRSKRGYDNLNFLLKKLTKAINKSKLQNYEIILLDNCSYINLIKLKKKFKTINLNVFRNKNTIPAFKNFAKAINYSRGKYIFLHSDDDFIEENFFLNLKHIFKNKDYDFLMWKVKSFSNNKIGKYNWINQWPKNKSCEFKPNNKLIKFPIPSSGYIAKRKFFEKHGTIGSQKEGYDLAFACKLLKYAKKAYFSYESISYYRFHSNQSSKLDDPTDMFNKLNFFINSSKIFYKFFKKEKAKTYIKLYLKHYFFLHVATDMMNREVKKTNKRKFNKLGKFLYGDYWNKKYISYFKYILPRVNYKKI